MRSSWALGIWICVSATAQQLQFDPAGKWQVVAQPQGRPEIKMELTLGDTGKEMGGTVLTQYGVGQVKNYKQNGADLSFNFRISLVSIDVKATGDGNSMTGVFAGGLKGTFVARRGEEPKEGVETGYIAGSSYRIDVPAKWNGTLLLYCHGYGPPARFDKKDKPSAPVQALLDAGFAVGQAGYSKGGWAVKEGIEDTEALRRLWVSRYGKPKRAFVAGHSLGGLVALATIEKFGEHYDGAMPMCGPLGPSLALLQQHVFDSLVLFDYYFPGAIGSPMKISDTVLSDVAKAVRADGAKRAQLGRHIGVKETELVGVIGFFAYIQKELVERAGGNPFDNRNTIYSGSLDDQWLNRGVKRYAPELAAVEYLRAYYTPSAKVSKPVLSLHTTYDPLVPAWAANTYGCQLRQQGSEEFYVQRFVARDGHCSFTAEETMNAFRDLLEWREWGKRPDPGEQGSHR